MRKLFINICFCFFAVMCIQTNVYAVKMCLKTDPARVACTGGQNNLLDWVVNCGGVIVQGISVCINGTVGSRFDARTTTEPGNACYCRMVAPVLSPYYQAVSTKITNCLSECTAACKGSMVNLIGFRTAILTTTR